jgi:transcription factor IIIB subunit 2
MQDRNLPIIDPSIYIPRFCSQLDFGDKVDLIKKTAKKLLQGMKLDWMSYGRRPAGLCGAAILIAARYYGKYYSLKNIIRVIYIMK